MKKEMLVYIAALITLDVTFTIYLGWLRIQPRHDAAHAKTPPPASHTRLNLEMRR